MPGLGLVNAYVAVRTQEDRHVLFTGSFGGT
jgi:hypothetical protein